MQTQTAARGDLAAWLRFTLAPGVFEPWQRALLRAFGSPGNALGASVDSASQVVPPPVAEGLARGPSGELVEKALRWLELPGHHLVTLEDPDYPQALLQIPDPPTVLYVVGRLDLLNVPAFAVVGSRNATLQGVQDAKGFSQALSTAGLAIVSGLALGIDAAAHRGGLAGPSSSIAVMGTGADEIYPRRNAGLAAELASHGTLVSEFALGTPPAQVNFPRRNRVISGLSRGVLVVEAALRSGSLITAHVAAEQGRDVFALPGSIHSPLSRGCHKLIKEGAKLVECADDILEELHIEARTQSPSEAFPCTREQRRLLNAMGYAPVTIDAIAAATRMSASAVCVQLSELELGGAVAGLAGGLFQRLAKRVIE